MGKYTEYYRKWSEENKEKFIEYGKRYRKDNSKKISLLGKEYREKNKEKLSDQKKEYYKKNKAEILIKRKKQYRDKYGLDGYLRLLPKENAKRRNPAYHSWLAMMHRTLNPKCAQFKDYGGRGISVCERWKKFENFFEDMGNRPDKKTLGRIDNDKDYEPGNCRWENMKQQQRNKRSNRILEVDGEKHCVAEWAEIKGIHFNLIHTRLGRGWSVDRAVNTKKQRNDK